METVAPNQHIKMWQSPELRAGPPGLFRLSICNDSLFPVVTHCRQPQLPLETEKLFILPNAVTQGSRLLCTQQR